MINCLNEATDEDRMIKIIPKTEQVTVMYCVYYEVIEIPQ